MILRRLILRILFSVFLLVAVAVISFSLFHLIPGDPALRLLSDEMGGAQPTEEMVEVFRRAHGFDRPYPEQFLTFVTRAMSGDLGTSLRTGQPVAEEIAHRLGQTLQLASASLALTLVLSLGLGFATALRPQARFDRIVRWWTSLMLATPGFWLALVLLLVFSLHLGWLPVAGYGTPAHIVMPSVVAALVSSGLCIRFVRDRVRQTLQLPHLQTARMKGLSPAQVFLGHALPFALPALIALFGLQAARMIDSLIVIETVFGWPGLGSYIAEAVMGRDLPAMQASLMTAAGVYILLGLLSDILIVLVDPRAEAVL
ncbi:ABC transporter permease [Aquicoccus sp. SU-CL01552]|uniref:ABC transporter permease n=1 Tax=Aquicoccus sp. SU-CL01552 TaxID=3127656 RepID=UPI003105CB29